MSIRPIPGKPGQFISLEVRWIAEGAELPANGELAYPVQAHAHRERYLDKRWRCEQAMRSTTDRRRRRRWRGRRRARGREYARLLARGPSSKRPVCVIVTVVIRLTEARECNMYDTVRVKDQ